MKDKRYNPTKTERKEMTMEAEEEEKKPEFVNRSRRSMRVTIVKASTYRIKSMARIRRSTQPRWSSTKPMPTWEIG